jgi:KamA family protein
MQFALSFKNNKDKNSIRTIDELKKYAALSPREEFQLRKVIGRHPMCITPYYASLIDWSDPADPIRKIAVPSQEELNLSGSYDTSGELENTKMPGLQHKYSQTALILTTNRCAVYCRYCFRKRLVGLPTKEILQRFEDAARYIDKHKEINNVLLSGGDPFVLPTAVLDKFLRRLFRIRHLDFIRFGTRVPVTLPQRIDLPLRMLIKKYSSKDRRIYVVTQFNHPREITPQAVKGIAGLIDSRAILNNQTVLLKGVNDRPDILASLQEGLVRIGVNPYYVFQCRPVKRVKQSFQITLYRGYHIVEAAKKILNGHAKRFKYVMSHRTGKIDVVGIAGNNIYFKYHQAKDSENTGKFFQCRLDKNAGWLDDLTQQRFLSRILSRNLSFPFL